jgi:hypothetical protein
MKSKFFGKFSKYSKVKVTEDELLQISESYIN